MGDTCVDSRFWLIRHPETDWNAEKRYQSRSDRAWSKAGADGAARLADYFKNTKARRVFSSPSRHALALAEAICNSADLERPLVSEALLEINHGDWEGLSYEEMLNTRPEEAQSRFDDLWNARNHGGESLSEVAARVEEFWQEIREPSSREDTLIVTHSAPIKLFLCLATGISLEEYWRFQIDTASISRLEFSGDSTIVGCTNLAAGDETTRTL